MKFKKLAIVRVSYNYLNTKTYNIQEIGLALGLTNHNISTDIYSRYSDINQEIIYYKNNGCTVRLIPIKGFTFLGKIAIFPELLKNILIMSYDVVQVNEDSSLMTPFILKACHKAGIKTILYQGMYTNYTGLNRIYQLILDLLFLKSNIKYIHKIYAKTAQAKQYLTNKGYKNIILMPIGLNTYQEKKLLGKKNLINHFRKNHEKILLYVGKIEDRRNPIFLVEILASLKRNSPINIGLLVIGNGPMKNEMIQSAKANKILNNILFIDTIPNNQMHEIYKYSNLFLLPTNNEIYGMVIMEALYYGIPVISTPEAGPNAILKDINLGICIELTLEKWIEKIVYYLKLEDSIVLQEYRKNYITNNFDWNVIAQKYITNAN